MWSCLTNWSKFGFSIPYYCTFSYLKKNIYIYICRYIYRLDVYLCFFVLTVSGAVVPLASLLVGHVELCAQADALLWSRLEEQNRQLPDAAPLTADQLRCLETNLLYAAVLRVWRVTHKVWFCHFRKNTITNKTTK